MKIIDMLGKPCPMPIIEAKKALGQGEDCVLVKVDNYAAVQNLEKMAKGYGFDFSYVENSKTNFDVTIGKNEKSLPVTNNAGGEIKQAQSGASGGNLVVVISRDSMGQGSEELGKILIKGFIYSLTELPVPPAFLLFFNSGINLTSAGANTIDDLKKLEAKGTKIFTCGACLNYFGLLDKLAAGEVTNMYGITEKMASAGNIINI